MEDTWASGRRFKPQGTQGRSIKDLNYWRNKFVHFFPLGFSLSTVLLSPIFFDCINIIKFLAFESGHVDFENKDQKAQVKNLLGEISEDLTGLCT